MDLILPNSAKCKLAEKWAEITGSLFHISSMAIKYNVIIKYKSIIQKLIVLDPFLYYLSLIENGDLGATSDILTIKKEHRFNFGTILNETPSLKIYNILANYMMTFYIIDILYNKCLNVRSKFIKLHYLHKLELSALGNIKIDITINDLVNFIKAWYDDPLIVLGIFDFIVSKMPNKVKQFYRFARGL